MKRCAAVAGVAIMLAACSVTAPLAARSLEATRVLAERLGRGQRAEASVTLQFADPLTGASQRSGGTLALEAPGFARLDFTSTGERLALRDDGGDWLQPRLRQLVRGGPSSAGVALAWSGVLQPGGAQHYRERRLGARHYELVSIADADTQRVRLGADGLPSRIEFRLPTGEKRVVQLARWKFVRPRGRAHFVLEPPAGFEVVELP